MTHYISQPINTMFFLLTSVMFILILNNGNAEASAILVRRLFLTRIHFTP